MVSFNYENVYIKDFYIVVGPKEKESKLKKYNAVMDDYYFNKKTFELAEMEMQRMVISNLIKNNISSEFDFLIGGDLINQIAITSYNAMKYNIPFIGIYSACATFIETLLIGGNLISMENANNIICITSSHNLTAERQYRYPTEYGNRKKQTATVTATASVGAIITSEKTKYKINGGMIGRVVGMGIKDVNNMGAIMAPACADTLHEYLNSKHKNLKDYDLILTGDLGKVGLEILKAYYYKAYKEKISNIKDAGSEIYYKKQDMYSGSSGPCSLPLFLFSNIINNPKYKKILLLGTGSLHNPVLVNQKESIPAICHALELEVLS